MIEQPPPGFGSITSLGTFSRGRELGAQIGGSPSRDRSRTHHTITVATDLTAIRVPVIDEHHHELALTDIRPRPDQRTRLFIGSTASLDGDDAVTAYRDDGTEHAHHRFQSEADLLANRHTAQLSVNPVSRPAP